jgi:hypothetical protein
MVHSELQLFQALYLLEIFNNEDLPSPLDTLQVALLDPCENLGFSLGIGKPP